MFAAFVCVGGLTSLIFVVNGQDNRFRPKYAARFTEHLIQPAFVVESLSVSCYIWLVKIGKLENRTLEGVTLNETVFSDILAGRNRAFAGAGDYQSGACPKG